MARRQSITSYDPRKAEWNGTSIEEWEPSKWKQWRPKATGTDYCATAEREYLRMRYAVQQANTQLDIGGVKVKLKLTSPKSIGLQGTFPCKEGDVGKNSSLNKQYVISLAIAANDAGVKTAVAKAQELDLLLMTKEFQWTPELLGKQAQKVAIPGEEKPVKLISELIEEYEKEFWKTHEKSRQGLRNWKNDYLKYLKKLPLDGILSTDTLSQAFSKTQPNTASRFCLTWQLRKFCNFCGFEGQKIIDSYATGRPERKPRNVPSDDEILEGFNKIGVPLVSKLRKTVIQPERWQWTYGMIATYGIRPHELFAIDLETFIDPSNTFHLVKLDPTITDSTKTGARNCLIPPLHPEWVELFDLKNVKKASLAGSLSSKSTDISEKFKRTDIGFTSYDLRQAYAIRGHKLRVPIKAMADYMGHTVQEHTKTYQRWMNKDANFDIYKDVLIEKQAATKEDLKARIAEQDAEIASLKADKAALKAEVESLRKLVTQYQLEKAL